MKTIWITGGSSGIGYTTAEKFLNEGWRVIISSSKNENLIQAKINLEKKTKSKEIYSFKCDISNRNEVNYVVKKISTEISSIDIALLNAAAYSPNKTQDFNIENYEFLIDVNLKGTLYCIDALKKEMKKNHSGNIAIVSSPVGYRGLPTAGAYGLTKAGLINLAETLFFDFKKFGIKIYLINPGFIRTKSTNLNSFPMPFIKSAEYAAEKIYKGLVKNKRFEIIFPYFFLMILKLGRILPYPLYFYLVTRITGL